MVIPSSEQSKWWNNQLSVNTYNFYLFTLAKFVVQCKEILMWQGSKDFFGKICQSHQILRILFSKIATFRE